MKPRLRDARVEITFAMGLQVFIIIIYVLLHKYPNAPLILGLSFFEVFIILAISACMNLIIYRLVKGSETEYPSSSARFILKAISYAVILINKLCFLLNLWLLIHVIKGTQQTLATYMLWAVVGCFILEYVLLKLEQKLYVPVIQTNFERTI